MNIKNFTPVLLAVLALTLQTTRASSSIYFSTTVNPVPLGGAYASAPVSSPGASSFVALDSGALVSAETLGNVNPNVISVLGPVQNVVPEPSVTAIAMMEGFDWVVYFSAFRQRNQSQVVAWPRK